LIIELEEKAHKQPVRELIASPRLSRVSPIKHKSRVVSAGQQCKMATALTNSKIFVDVYTTIAYPAVTGRADPLKQRWSPTNCTLIHTATSALLCDCPPTIDEAQKLVEWIKTTIPGKTLKYFWTTHAHGDHFLGFPVIQHAFPGAKAVASEAVTQGSKRSYAPPFDQVWSSWFPDQLPEARVDFEVLQSNTFKLDDFEMKVYDVEHGDTAANSFLHVPALDLVVAGDLVYGDCYQFLAEANTRSKRAGWRKALDDIASLRPHVVIPGHTRASQVFGAYLVPSTKRYIEVWEEELEKANSTSELYEAIVELYPERWNLFILEWSCVESFKNKGL
jgi:glyoxylase-like metal-dependent hydrolase (beta-lactamase superfamily II)